VTEAGRRGDREAALAQGSSAGGNSLVIADFPGTLAASLLVRPPQQSCATAPYPRLTLKNLFTIAEWQDEIPWQPFRDGVDIHRLYGDGIDGPSAALIRFRGDGRVPAHEHTGYEHILVLAGTQRDNNGTTAAGSLIVSAPGTQHSILSEGGCIVLAIYEKPVKFLAD
jgi:quercetin dioxygenase-like cupin family protein